MILMRLVMMIMISANKNNANNDNHANANDANYSNAYYADFLAINVEPFVLNTYGWCLLTRFKVLDWPILAPPPLLIGRHFFGYISRSVSHIFDRNWRTTVHMCFGEVQLVVVL